mmetsp:Transcript_11109/g.27810  ORF Transcript_11109/g.27810 Transcript_11109/m.27810 type:complete len:365 (+) Transcript_11109:42-1136(+)
MDSPNRAPETSKLTPSEAKQVPFKEKLPNIEDTLQMARLANMVYDAKPIGSYKAALAANKQAGKSVDPKDKYKQHLVDVGGEKTEMWYYECEAEGTEAIITFSPKNNRCTVVFRGTETKGEAFLKDAFADAKGLGWKVALAGPDDEKVEHPECKVHMGFRGQYYGTVTEFRNDGEVREELRADGKIVDMVLETALFQKVDKVLQLQKELKKDTEIFVTGHSLGAALSVLCGIRLALKYPEHNIQVLNFGCPKVGNPAFWELVNNRENLCVQRVAHKSDVITRAPNLDYNHVGHTIHIDENAEPRAFKWHAGCHFWTNWNPIVGVFEGGVGHHLMDSYIKALNTHANKSNPSSEKQWVTEYAQVE